MERLKRSSEVIAGEKLRVVELGQVRPHNLAVGDVVTVFSDAGYGVVVILENQGYWLDKTRFERATAKRRA